MTKKTKASASGHQPVKDMQAFVRLKTAALKLLRGDKLDDSEANFAGSALDAMLRGEDVQSRFFKRRGRGEHSSPRHWQDMALHYGALKKDGADAAALEVAQAWRTSTRAVTRAAAAYRPACEAAEAGSTTEIGRKLWLSSIETSLTKHLKSKRPKRIPDT